ncbi:TPR repeat-containing protein [Ectocarpus siliculosus]|uniref:TPR repeat-containing protein n=1 Tax=Ectocarpus siliculosus TaxID=2880 RepID=D8LR50_ECTSI|nr:TPR repeat-containing protein [Ectocarpus siliculosus]|eukprot:CBN77723.1 TPR repeat-containing protein [Ectocarpus siliculosus]
MRPNARKARTLLEDAMLLDPDNPWAIHFYTHLMEVGAEAGAAVAPAQRLEYLVPGAPHLQHMQSHVEFRTGQWHDASEANLRAVALPDSDASYPDHNMDMLMWALGVEGRRTESGSIGRRLTAYSTARVLAGVTAPLLPPERYLAQEPLHLCAFADWEGVLALAPPPDGAEFPLAAYRFARSFAFANAKDWDSYRREQGFITAGVEIMEGRTQYYGVYNAAELTRILDLLSRAEGLRGGIHVSAAGTTPGDVTTAATAGPEELELLRQAVEMQDALGYDEPPRLPVPTRLFLAAALLRGVDSGGGGGGIEGGVDGSSVGDGDTATTTAPVSAAPPTLTTPTTTAAAAAAVEEAEAVLLEVDAEYPGMGRTLLGLWRCREALGKHDEALALRERFLASWGPYSEVWLEDSAHVGGVLGGGDGGGGGSGGGAPVVGAGLDEEEGLHHHAPQGVDGKDYRVLAGLTVAAAALSLSAFLLAAARRRSGGGCGGGVFRALLPRGAGGSAAGAEAVSIVVPGRGQGRRARGRSDNGNSSGGHGYRTIGEGSGDDGSVVQIDGGVL